MNGTATHGPDTRIDRIYVTTSLLPAVIGVEVFEVPLDASDHHVVVWRVNRSALVDMLTNYALFART
ncbi:Endonuclease/Exonuclease/phosphatase family protein OS=Streptomyces microflavus OX=1919 GN=Smic_06890 PE=4 SV=1 [Streptomyces microflavus]